MWERLWRAVLRSPLFQVAMLLWCLAIFAIYFGLAAPLAAWWFGTPAPTRAQVEGFALGTILIMAWPILGYFAMIYWRQGEEDETPKRSHRRGKP